MKEPKRHHYIPQFILRSFCGKDGLLSYYDIASKQILPMMPSEVFMTRNLYRDEINHPEMPVQIELDLGRYENEASQIIKRFLKANEVMLSIEEEEKLRLFFAIMAFRADRVKESFGDAATESYKEYYSHFQEDGNLIDFWKRNLGYLVNCRSLREVLEHPKIDAPIKAFMMRDTVGIVGLYFIIVEARGGEDFLLSDCYPTVFEGVSDDGLSRGFLYSVYPISPRRALLLVDGRTVTAPKEVSGLRKDCFRRPDQLQDGRLYYRVRRLNEIEVRRINESALENAAAGVVFKDAKRVKL